MLPIDGKAGEGGGQVLRTALGLSLVTGTPFRITDIRGGRAKPGLLRQHLTCVQAAARIGAAEVEGDTLGSTALTFRPHGRVGGDLRFAVGSAGSALLVVQAVLPGLLVADVPTRLVVEGGTHNSAAPPYDFVARVFAPLLGRMGARVTVTLEKHGFYPAGGGRVVVEVEPAPLAPIELLERGPVEAVRARALYAAIPPTIAHRELNVLRERLGLDREALRAEEVPRPVGPGNAVMVEVACAGATELFTAFGEKRVRAEDVAARVADEVEAWLALDVPVGEHLADQLLIPMALATRATGRPGRFRSGPLSLHATTNAAVIERFLPVRFETREVGGGVEVACRG